MTAFFSPQHKNPIKKAKRGLITQAERKHMGKIAELGCIVSNCNSPACIHHIRTGMGLGQRANHYQTIPLCYYHHQGKEGIHTLGTRVWQEKYGTELEMLARCLARICAEIK